MSAPMPEVVALAADHGGYDLKCLLLPEVVALGYAVLDLGTEGREAVDYPAYAAALARAIAEGRAHRGVLICGSGIGMSIAANRHAAVRGALCHDALTARLARQHNDANVLILGGRILGPELARDCLKIFLTTPFEGGRHARRIAQLA